MARILCCNPTAKLTLASVLSILIACQAPGTHPTNRDDQTEGEPLAVAAASSASDADANQASLPELEYLWSEVRQYGSDDAKYDRVMDVVRLTNNTPYVFEYTGDNPTWTDYDRLVWRGSAWQPSPRMICASCYAPQRLAPGGSVDLITNSVRGLTRVGLEVRRGNGDAEHIIWSEPYTRTLMINGELFDDSEPVE